MKTLKNICKNVSFCYEDKLTQALVTGIAIAGLAFGTLIEQSRAPDYSLKTENYIVQKGDNLWNIAKKQGIDFWALKSHNPQIKNHDKIYPGQEIKFVKGYVGRE
jgi:spore coat assembly protein SafA